MYNHKLKIFLFVIIIAILGYILFRSFNKSDVGYFSSKDDKLISQNDIPVTISWQRYTMDKTGISFSHPETWKITRANNNIWELGAITIKIENLSCTNPQPSKPLNNPIKIYGYDTQINESLQTAYICNNSKTACLDIYSNNTKMSEEFYHGFISTLNISKDFDEIKCY